LDIAKVVLLLWCLGGCQSFSISWEEKVTIEKKRQVPAPPPVEREIEAP
jgi:hypothetical protein